MTSPHLSNEDRDQLAELLNIGVSHASTTLSKMLGRRIAISVPTVELHEAKTLSLFTEHPLDVSIAVLLRLSGGIEGYVFLLFPHDASTSLLQTLTGKTVADLNDLNEFDRSVFQEIGNVVTGGMLTGLSQFLHLPLTQSVPDVAIDMRSAMFNSLAASLMQTHEKFIALDVGLCVEATSDTVACTEHTEAVAHLFLFLEPEAAQHVLLFTHEMAQS